MNLINNDSVVINDRFVLGQGLYNTKIRHIIGYTHNKYIMTTDKGDTITFKEKYIIEWTIAFKDEECDLFSDYFTFSGLGYINGKYVKFDQKSHFNFEELIRYDTGEIFRIISINIINNCPNDKIGVKFNNCHDFCEHMDIVQQNIARKLDKTTSFFRKNCGDFDFENTEIFTKLGFENKLINGNIYYLVTDDDSAIIIRILESKEVFVCSLLEHEEIIIEISIYKNDVKMSGVFDKFDILAEINVIKCNDENITNMLNGCHFCNIYIYKQDDNVLSKCLSNDVCSANTAS